MVRQATIADVSRISEIHVYGWRSAYRGMISDEYLFKVRQVATAIELHTRIIVSQAEHSMVFDDGLVRGFALHGLSRDPSKPEAWEIGAIYVEPAFQGSGVGSALMREAEASARQRGFGEIMLWALAANAKAHGFYRSHGFSPDGGTKHDPELDLDEIRFTKALA